MKGNSFYKFDNDFIQRCGINERVTEKITMTLCLNWCYGSPRNKFNHQ
jgi:hypothetical protein